MSADNRAHPRYALEVDAEVRHAGGKIPARTRDVSRGGGCLSIPVGLPLGAEVTISIALVFDEETFSEPLALRARVVWCTPIGDRHQLGVTFIGMTAEQRHYLEMFLRYLREGQRREAQEHAAAEGEDDGDGESSDPFG
jgi:hypothetical protein